MQHPNPFLVSARAALVAAVAITSTGSLRLLAADEPPKPKWESSAGVGVALSSGNSESFGLTINGNTQLKKPHDEFRAWFDMGYGEATPRKTAPGPDPDSEKNSDFIRGAVQYNRLFGERWFAYGRVDALHDDIADVNYRFTLSPGAGYYFLKRTNVTLSAEVGPGYVFEEVGFDQNDYATLRIAERLEWKFSPTARLIQGMEFLPEVTDWDNFIVNFVLGVEADLTKKLVLRLVATDTYDNAPATYAWGEDYEKNDLKLVASLNYKF